jgi:LSD1 subclass zinc finger protein
MSDDVIGQEPTKVEVEPSLDEVRARLQARGLVASAPPIVIPKEPRPEPAPSTEPPPPVVPQETHWSESERDEWDVEPGSDRTNVACPRCRTILSVPLEATRVTCADCERTWRYAVCDGCNELSLTVERQESWNCTKCGAYSRAWWRTDTPEYLSRRVLAKRLEVHAEEQRAIAREGMRARRWKLIAFAIVCALLAAVIVGVTRAQEKGAPAGRAVACSHFREVLEGIASGRLSQTQVDDELEKIETEAAGEAELAGPIGDLRASSVPTSGGFVVARGALVDACGADFGRSR